MKAQELLNHYALGRRRFSEIDLSGENLRDANLQEATFYWVNFQGADLRGVDFQNANFDDANFKQARLQNANFEGATLECVDFQEAELQGANLQPVWNDLEFILKQAPAEITALKTSLVEGRVDGSLYEGRCACLNGTMSRSAERAGRTRTLDKLIDLRDADRPIECFFVCIKPGDTPDNSWHVAEVLKQIEAFEESFLKEKRMVCEHWPERKNIVRIVGNYIRCKKCGWMRGFPLDYATHLYQQVRSSGELKSIYPKI